MVFRAPALRARTGRVAYGPFPIRIGLLLGSVGVLVLGVIVFAIAIEREEVRCDAAGACVADGRIARPRSFAAREVKDVRVVEERGSKGGTYGVVVIDAPPQQLRLMRTTPRDAASAAGELRAGFARREPFAVAVDGPIWMVAIAIGALAAAIAMVRSALFGIGRLDLELAQGGAALRVTRRVLGIPVGARELSLEGVRDVSVEHGRISTFFTARGQLPPACGRLLLHDADGSKRPVTEPSFPGTVVHLRAAIALRAALELEPRPGGVEDELARTPLTVTPLGSRIGFAWLGICTGSLVGAGATAIVAFAVRAATGVTPDTVIILPGAGLGAASGVALSLYFTRARLPR